MDKKTFWNSRFLSFATCAAYIGVVLSMVFSLYYMNRCVQYEADAQNNRYEIIVIFSHAEEPEWGSLIV